MLVINNIFVITTLRLILTTIKIKSIQSNVILKIICQTLIMYLTFTLLFQRGSRAYETDSDCRRYFSWMLYTWNKVEIDR